MNTRLKYFLIVVWAIITGVVIYYMVITREDKLKSTVTSSPTDSAVVTSQSSPGINPEEDSPSNETPKDTQSDTNSNEKPDNGSDAKKMPYKVMDVVVGVVFGGIGGLILIGMGVLILLSSNALQKRIEIRVNLREVIDSDDESKEEKYEKWKTLVSNTKTSVLHDLDGVEFDMNEFVTQMHEIVRRAEESGKPLNEKLETIEKELKDVEAKLDVERQKRVDAKVNRGTWLDNYEW
jgi:hypothetical protein